MQLLLEYRKSYTAGLLQSKAFRILKKKTNEVLEPLGVNATDWGVLGLLLKEKDGLRLTDLSREVGVKAPYITKSITTLAQLGYVSVGVHKEDTRAKIATITKEGKLFVGRAEKLVAKQLQFVFKNVPIRDLLGYVRTLDVVVRDFGATAQEVELGHMSED